MGVKYQAMFREGPWDNRRILVIDDEVQETITVLEEEPAITELLAELGLSDQIDPVSFEYVLVGYLRPINSFLYVPKGKIRAMEQ